MELTQFPRLFMTNGQTFSKETLAGKWTVLYFYPRDSSPGCTLEGQQFRDRIKEFSALGVQILGISRNKLQAHENFKEKQCFPFELISDPDGLLCSLFGVIKEKKLYGKLSIGIERSTFVIAPNLTLAKEWRKVSVKGHDEIVLCALKMLIQK